MINDEPRCDRCSHYNLCKPSHTGRCAELAMHVEPDFYCKHYDDKDALTFTEALEKMESGASMESTNKDHMIPMSVLDNKFVPIIAKGERANYSEYHLTYEEIKGNWYEVKE